MSKKRLQVYKNCWLQNHLKHNIHDTTLMKVHHTGQWEFEKPKLHTKRTQIVGQFHQKRLLNTLT